MPRLGGCLLCSRWELVSIFTENDDNVVRIQKWPDNIDISDFIQLSEPFFVDFGQFWMHTIFSQTFL